MEIENRRGCMISGRAPEKVENKNTASKSAPEAGRIKGAFTGFKGRLGNKRNKSGKLVKELGGEVRRRSRAFAAGAAGVVICAIGVGALGTYCTVGVNYYYGGRLLCTVAAADDTAAIIGAAARRADSLGVEEPEIEVSAKLALKKDIVGGDEAVDAILAASPELCRGCALKAGDQVLMTAADKASLEAALAEYTARYDMGGGGRLSAQVTFEESIVRRDELTAREDMVGLLESGGVLSVLDTVTEVKSEPIPFEVSQVEDAAMYLGDSEVVTPGQDGVLETTVENVYSNGQLLTSAELSSATVSAPVAQVVKVGTLPRNALNDGFSCPVGSYTLTSKFGQRWGRQHKGIDMAVPTGTPVYAAAAGTVKTAKSSDNGYGIYVQIDHGYGIVTTYAHLSSMNVQVGQTVNRGDLIAYSGSTGNSTGPHLHFEVIDNGNYLNPLEHLI